MHDIESLFESYKNAVLHRDVEAFISIFDEDLRVFDMWEWEYNGLAPWRNMVGGWFSFVDASEKIVVAFEDIRINAAGEMTVASAFARFSSVSGSGEELRHLYNRFTWVAQKKQGQWKIIHEHTSGPADHKTLKVALQRPAAGS